MKVNAVLVVAAAIVAIPAALEAEPRYAFRERLAVLHPGRRAADAAPPRAGETVVDSSWRVVAADPSDPVLAHAAADFSDYLAKSMGVVPSGSGRASVEIAVDPTLRRLQSKVEVAESSIRVTGATAREAFQGAIRLEDMMTARGIPAATRGVRTFTRLFSPRMTHSGWEVEKFPDVYLDQLAHAGMDSILVFIADPPDVTRNGREDMNALVERCRRRGIDVYAYCWFPVKAAKYHPDDPEAQAWYDEIYGSIIRNAPGIRGIICVGESVAFPGRDGHTAGFWWGRREDRVAGKHLNGFWPTLEWVTWLEKVKKATRRYRSDLEILFWTYNWYWADEKDRLPLLERIPTDITLHVTFEMGDIWRKKLGIDTKVWDYSITQPGPGKVFASEAEVAKRRGIALTSMSNTGGRTWDVGCVPFHPVPARWLERFRALREAKAKWGLSGLMECHHYGFQPNFIAELAKEAFTEETDAVSLDASLRAIAARDFGFANADAVLAAWQDWSDAFAWHSAHHSDLGGPQRVGPVYPLVLPGESRPQRLEPQEESYNNVRYNRGGWKYLEDEYAMPVKELDARIEMTRREIAGWESGCARLRAILPSVPEAKRQFADRQLANGEFHLATARTLLNARRFRKYGFDPRANLEALLGVLDDEESNVRAAMAVVDRDSALGWEPTMLYVSDRPNLEWKLRQLDDVRRDLAARFGASLPKGRAMSVQVIADPDGPLEPSVLNEVEHALSRAPACATNAPAAFGDIFCTNGLSATAVAVSLVSRQGSSGEWIVNGTNATAEAVAILTELVGGR